MTSTNKYKHEEQCLPIQFVQDAPVQRGSVKFEGMQVESLQLNEQ